MIWKGDRNSEFLRPDPGTYLARCVRLIDLGTQKGEYQGQPTARRQVLIFWELPYELIPEGEHVGEPYLVSKFYTQSLNEKANLRHDLINWRGRDFTEEELSHFEAKRILGACCQVTLTQTDKGKTKVTGVTALAKGGPKPLPQLNPSVYFSLEPNEFDWDVFDNISEKLKAMIGQSPEFKALADDKPRIPALDYADVSFGGEEGDDGIPF